MELYRIHQDQKSKRLDKRISADAQFLGVDPAQVAKQHHHRFAEDKMFRYLKTVYPKSRGAEITHVDIPDKDSNGQSTDDPNTATLWRSVRDPAEMTERLIERNIKHFGQASKTPFATPPLLSEFGYCGTNEAAVNLVRKSSYPSSLDPVGLTDGTNAILNGLTDGHQSPEMPDQISFEEFWRAFRTWDEQTSTSPSGRHLGHYKSLLISDGNDDQYDDDHPNPSRLIQQVYYHVAMAALYSANTLNRWCRSSNMMLEKVSGQPKINKLRVIHLYEADYNLLLKILWARRLVWHSHNHNKLHGAQAGSRPQHRCSDVVLRKEMNYQYARFTRTNIATVDNDAKACYDRIICNLAMLVSQYHGMSNRACKMHSKTLQAMLFTIRTKGGDSKEHYKHSPDTPIHGSGQGSCASPSLWLHISTILLKLLDEVAQGMTRHDVIKNCRRRISAEGFVDDIALFINQELLTDDNLAMLYEYIHHDINAWQSLLASSGGKLELSKCFYYVLSWTFNKFGDAVPKTLQEIRSEVNGTVQITDPDTNQSVMLEQKDINQVHKTLGVFKSMSGSETDQFQALMAKSKTIATQTKLGQLTRYQARRAYTAIYIPSMTYSLIATSLSEAELHNIQSKALQAFLPSMGYEPTFPRAIVHGPRTFGGLNLGHLYTEMHVAKVGAMLSHIQSGSELGEIMLMNLNWLQLHSGLLQPVLQYKNPIQYLQSNWFLHLQEFLFSIGGSIIIPGQWRPQLERVHDIGLMDAVLSSPLTNADRRIFNNWRIYFQASTLSDITSPDGTRIQQHYWNYTDEHGWSAPIRKSRHNWPRQQSPHSSTFHIWKRGLRSACKINQRGELQQTLGDWLVIPHESYNDWNDYLDARNQIVYRKQSDGKFWSFHSVRTNTHRSIYSALPEDIVDDIPNTSVPIQIDQGTATTLLVIHNNFMGPYQSPQTNIPLSFDDYLHTLPTWRSDLLMHWSTKPIHELTALFNANQLLRIASDGSYTKSNDYGAFGAVIGVEQDILMQIRGHAPGPDGLKSSFRSELYGLLAAIILMCEVSTYCNFQNRQEKILQFYVDNTSVITRVQDHRKRPLHLGEMTNLDLDVELQILHELRQLEQMGFKIPPIQHVKAHQDDHTSYLNLSREAQLNVEADILASSMSSQSFYNIPYTMFPTTKIQLNIEGRTITSKYKECLRTAYLTQDLYDYYVNKFNWEDGTIDDIWWDVHGSAINKLSHSDRQKIQKFNIRRLHTNNRRHMFQESISAQCQFCEHTVETNDHLLQCQHCSELRNTIKAEWELHINDSLSSDYTPNEVKTAITVALHCWLRQAPIPPLLSIYPNASHALRHAYEAQSVIGWDNFVRGKFSGQWAECIATHLSSGGISQSSMTSDRWATQLILDIWKGVLTLWDARNRELYGHDRDTQATKMKGLLLQDAHHLLLYSEHIGLSDIPWLQKTMQDLEQLTVIGLKAWIRNARTMVRLYHKERQRLSRDQVSDHSDQVVAGGLVGPERIPMDLPDEILRVGGRR